MKDASENFKAALAASGSFWTPERYGAVREGFREICKAYGWTPQFIHSEMKRLVPRDARAIPASDMTLRRFRAHRDKLTLFNSKRNLSGLLLTCEAMIERAGRNPVETPYKVRALVELAQEFRRPFNVEGLELKTRAGVGHRPVWYERQVLENISAHIFVPPFDHPENPEFPPSCPRFPATHTVQITIEGRTILIKDESYNPSASHKDRWAWEMITAYKKRIDQALMHEANSLAIQRYSMISTGSAAIALQSMLRVRQLPDLHVLMNDARRQPAVEDRLRSIGARVFHGDLETKFYTDEMVLTATDNGDGIDVTPRDAAAASAYSYYDWLSYEIINKEPRHIFVPFGSGGLFSNIVSIIHAEVNGKRDPRLQSQKDLMGITVYGATTDNPRTRLDMLYAKYRPTLPGVEALIAECIKAGSIGPRSKVYNDLEDVEAERAMAKARAEGIRTGTSGAAGLALFLRLASSIRTDEPLVVNTGCIFSPSL
ncbi:MAG TPA: PLP-dependent lyase/thiolase [Allosphingosinicella sp.]|jgi:cysteine synthase|uniref:PLP-dependent lyase/thiolase n=1 Tax=Allosphingosinicella sp. TaxID=2823234 RepID=UPI002F2900B6